MESAISLKEAVGGGYDEFWKSTKRYVVCKGSRASKKSTTAALKLIARLTMESAISLKEAVGGGYDEFWKSTKRYVVCKGSRASKKSTTAALKLTTRLMQMPLANALVVRQTQATLKDSCYAQLQWAINRLGVDKFWKMTVNPLQMTYMPTGQKIIFRGMDDSMKITSIAVEKGHLCFAWLN